MFKATVNDEKEFEVETQFNQVFLNNMILNWDMEKIGDEKYHLIQGNKSFTIEIIKNDKKQKLYHFKINGHYYQVTLRDQTDLLLQRLGINAASQDITKEVKAPMPGLILDIFVAEGVEVKKGEPLLILEAMKMENILKSPRDGIVKALKAQKGNSVEKNQILIQF